MTVTLRVTRYPLKANRHDRRACSPLYFCLTSLSILFAQKFAEKDIFGSDSELSDAPEAEGISYHPTTLSALNCSYFQRYHIHLEDFPKPPKHIGPIRPDEDESSAGESADDYEDSVPKKKRKVRRRRGGDEDEEVAEVGRRRTTQRKRKRKAERTEQDLSNLPKEEGSSFFFERPLYILKQGTCASCSGQNTFRYAA